MEDQIGIDKPSPRDVRRAVRDAKPETYPFEDDSTVPNSPLPLVIYRGAVRLPAGVDGAGIVEELFASNGWGESWRDGIYDYVHYHSKTHEVLGMVRGRALVRFGGENGQEITIKAGDVIIIPAGVSHQRLRASKNLLVVGAYPPGGNYDELRATKEAHDQAKTAIAQVPLPEKDPVYGSEGQLLGLWKK